MLENKSYIFNVRPSKADDRDYSFSQSLTPTRDVVDLREYDSLIEDQGILGSCVSHALTSAYENLVKQKYPESYTELSRLYHYYYVRYIEQNVEEDSGVFEIRNALKALKTYNICAESIWPYDYNKFTVKPSDEASTEAKKRTILDYSYTDKSQEMIRALNDNYPVVVGMIIYSSFFMVDDKDPIVKSPIKNDRYLGGHSVCLVGYSLEQKMFIAKNSFGKRWGDRGYCWIPFDYVDTHVFDSWIFNINDQQESSHNDDVVIIDETVIQPTIV